MTPEQKVAQGQRKYAACEQERVVTQAKLRAAEAAGDNYNANELKKELQKGDLVMADWKRTVEKHGGTVTPMMTAAQPAAAMPVAAMPAVAATPAVAAVPAVAAAPAPVQMTVTLPAGVQAGQQMQVQAPNGQMVMVAAPEGVPEGGQFNIMLPAA